MWMKRECETWTFDEASCAMDVSPLPDVYAAGCTAAQRARQENEDGTLRDDGHGWATTDEKGPGEPRGQPTRDERD